MKYFHPLHHIEQISDEMFASHLQITPCSLTTPPPPPYQLHCKAYVHASAL
jgi:hypothetical protein